MIWLGVCLWFKFQISLFSSRLLRGSPFGHSKCLFTWIIVWFYAPNNLILIKFRRWFWGVFPENCPYPDRPRARNEKNLTVGRVQWLRRDNFLLDNFQSRASYFLLWNSINPTSFYFTAYIFTLEIDPYFINIAISALYKLSFFSREILCQNLSEKNSDLIKKSTQRVFLRFDWFTW